MVFFSFEGLFVFLKQNLEFSFRMAPQNKHAQKARKVSNIIEGKAVLNIIEEQTIVVYVASPFQDIS
jgi:hypothetical protein